MKISAKMPYSNFSSLYNDKALTFRNKKIGKIIDSKIEKDSVIITAKIYKKYENQFKNILNSDNRLLEIAMKDQKVVVAPIQCERGE